MDRIDVILRNGSGTKPLHPAVKHALAFARKSIDKYYAKTDMSNIYRIAMSRFLCHPSDIIIYLTRTTSFPPPAQAPVLSAARVAEGLDRNH